jgi:hypothetical protein
LRCDGSLHDLNNRGLWGRGNLDNGCSRGFDRRGGSGTAAFSDSCERSANFDGLVFLSENLFDDSRNGRRDFGIDLVG